MNAPLLPRPSAAARRGYRKGDRVYVVDDDPNVCHSMAFLLKAHDLRCRAFPNGEALLEQIDRLDPGCILLDLCMPKTSGVAVQAELARRGNRLPVIAMTGGANLETARECLAMGAIELLEKPFAEEDLLAALTEAFALLDARAQERRSH